MDHLTGKSYKQPMSPSEWYWATVTAINNSDRTDEEKVNAIKKAKATYSRLASKSLAKRMGYK